MLSGEDNENGEKTTIGLISKKNNFARAAHFFGTFLCRQPRPQGAFPWLFPNSKAREKTPGDEVALPLL